MKKQVIALTADEFRQLADFMDNPELDVDMTFNNHDLTIAGLIVRLFEDNLELMPKMEE